MKKNKEEIQRLSQKYNINALLSVEANLISLDGSIDVKPEDMQYLDIVLCGFHKMVWGKSLKDNFKFLLKNYFCTLFHRTDKIKQINTEVYIKALKNNRIDVLTHLNNDVRVDVLAVAKVAMEQGTLIELNNKHLDLKEDEILKMAEMGVKFIANSDAHRPERIGKLSKIEELIKKLKIEDSVVNYNQLPYFLNYKRNEVK